ncbi:OadG family protein [Prosthecochloris sp. N3]|uniref:OadG family protein n=1 Tax=Prosthecochloris ethylica TaxID=2743976 RepID=A0ABR9XP90_9CHLB|nr:MULTISPECIES: OadG family transporter subunit [Prosthecochloris]MEC9486273.1 OadG family transporter subunit [Prosthecochloris sp.]MBF0586132.1 OadG family protein [Prosthecochloris ethylica]MBF0635838.1 OadG family protein [Prosthecochloris ethylica]NUK47486.1 OadG family protein [Prosthecochloris ethylica]RNA65031.1 sodium pump decarboxylase subunit gamma [Prosthecochloris sp. ZM_2]
MISDGLILLAVGMVVVFLFLLLLNLLISSMSHFLRDHALNEEKMLLEAEAEKRRKKNARKQRSGTPAAAEDAGRLTAVISAAIHAHTSR